MISIGVERPNRSGVGGPTETNVIRGEFARVGQLDWAVLCSRDGHSTILVLWGRPTSCPGEIRDPRCTTAVRDSGASWLRQDRDLFAMASLVARRTPAGASWKDRLGARPAEDYEESWSGNSREFCGLFLLLTSSVGAQQVVFSGSSRQRRLPCEIELQTPFNGGACFLVAQFAKSAFQNTLLVALR
jgi:hypothetical protein